MRAGHEVQAAIFDRDVIYRNPGRERADRVHGPVGGVLVPVGLLADLAGRLDHSVVVVDSDVAAEAQLACVLAQAGVEDDFPRLRIVGPQVDHLVEDTLVLF